VCFRDGTVQDAARPERAVPFARVIKQAFEQRIDLGARGFYATPGIGFDKERGQGTPFFYYTSGAAIAEVCIDRFTGDLRVERVDLLIDLGRSINPAIDRGQVIGGFVQGIGWVSTEVLRHGPDGRLWTDSPTTYKVPGVTDVPADFRIEFLQPRGEFPNLHGNKAVGEPPLLLAVSVWAAVKHALAEAGADPALLNLPASNEAILLALERSVQRTVGTGEGGLRQTGDLPVPQIQGA
jgi:xanthine dehydrogenase large subunit